MKFKHVSLFLLSVAFPAFSNVHADPYNVPALTAHLKPKLENIQAEYQTLRQKQQLSYLWDEDMHKQNNLFLQFQKNTIRSTENLKEMVATLFSFEDSNVRKQLEEFLRVFTSKDFLRVLFSNTVVNQLVDYSHPDIYSFFWWDKEHSENPSEIFFSLRARQAWDKTLDCGGVQTNVLLDITLMFAYDIRKDTVRFIGLKNKPIVNTKYVNMNFPIYHASGTQPSVQKDNSMFIE